jgi:protocatechuate 3,4-dioxygenase beta subunit
LKKLSTNITDVEKRDRGKIMPQQELFSKKADCRHSFLQISLLLPIIYLIVACSGSVNTGGSAGNTAASPLATTGAQAPVLTNAPTCNGVATVSQTEGPFYKPNSPERTSLREPGISGMPLTVTGYVLSTTCRPVAHALLDFWQADSNGNYDNTGFRLRGHQYTDNQGRYSLDTIVPGEYPGRTRHIHVKVQASSGPVLTTQLYFPGETRNDSDGIFSPELLMHMEQTSNGEVATFNFIIAV